MKQYIFVVMILSALFSGCGTAPRAPKGNVIYCSYAATGVAGLGKNYCELIADPGTDPKVRVVLDEDCHFAERRSAEYKAKARDVQAIQKTLSEIKVQKLDGYFVEEAMTGGTIYRIHVEYDTGEKITAQWYGHDIKDEAWQAYHQIERFFQPWRQKLEDQRAADRDRQ